MRRGFRILRIVKWTGALGCALCAAVLAVSAWHSFACNVDYWLLHLGFVAIGGECRVYRSINGPPSACGPLTVEWFGGYMLENGPTIAGALEPPSFEGTWDYP